MLPKGRSWLDRIPPAKAWGTQWPKSGRASRRAGSWNEHCRNFAMDMVAVARLAGGGDLTIGYGEITATIKVQHEKAAEPTALCKEIERVRLETSRAEQGRQAAAMKAAAEKDEARKEA